MIRVARRFHASLHYYVLVQLDLGRDAANIFAPADPRPVYADALQALYLASAGTIALQVLPLRTSDLAGLLGTLDQHQMRIDPELQDAWAAALREEMGRFGPAFRRGTTDAAQAALGTIKPDLDLLRIALWALQDKSPPPLTLLDVRALGRHARASAHAGERLVATSLSQPADHVLCQVFHEECHAISDRLVPTANRETRAGTAGFATHQRIEAAAVELGDRVIRAVAPHVSPAYTRWRGHFLR